MCTLPSQRRMTPLCLARQRRPHQRHAWQGHASSHTALRIRRHNGSAIVRGGDEAAGLDEQCSLLGIYLSFRILLAREGLWCFGDKG